MGDRHDGARKSLEIVLQNGQRHDVQIIGGLVQEQNIGGFHQNGEQIQPPPLSAGEPPNGNGLQISREEEALHHLVG